MERSDELLAEGDRKDSVQPAVAILMLGTSGETHLHRPGSRSRETDAGDQMG